MFLICKSNSNIFSLGAKTMASLTFTTVFSKFSSPMTSEILETSEQRLLLFILVQVIILNFYNYEQKAVGKFQKLSTIDFCMEWFTANLLAIAWPSDIFVTQQLIRRLIYSFSADKNLVLFHLELREIVPWKSLQIFCPRLWGSFTFSFYSFKNSLKLPKKISLC